MIIFHRLSVCVAFALLSFGAGRGPAQAAGQVSPPAAAPTPPELHERARPRPVTPQLPRLPVRGLTEPAEPLTPDPAEARPFHDAKYKVSFSVPAGWNFEQKDGLLSNFGVETPTARRKTDVRGVAAINFNPWPVSTFAGALFYYSVIPRAKAEMCAAQTSTRGVKPLPEAQIDGTAFHHGTDHHGKVCTEARDEVFTAMQGKSCLRFDLVVNTFCAETSGAQEITPAQLQDVDKRLAMLLGSVELGNGAHGDGERRAR
jgi:hypothetical protein